MKTKSLEFVGYQKCEKIGVTNKSDGISIDISDQVTFFFQGKISVPCYFIEIKGNLVTNLAIAERMEQIQLC